MWNQRRFRLASSLATRRKASSSRALLHSEQRSHHQRMAHVLHRHRVRRYRHSGTTTPSNDPLSLASQSAASNSKVRQRQNPSDTSFSSLGVLLGIGLSIGILSLLNRQSEEPATAEIDDRAQPKPSPKPQTNPDCLNHQPSTETHRQAQSSSQAQTPSILSLSMAWSKKKPSEGFSLRRWHTLRQMEAGSTGKGLESKYDVFWDEPIGEGSFGTVYKAMNKETGEMVALKKIPKKYTKEKQFLGEMNALLHLRQAGGHHGICALRDYFNERGHYYIALDLIEGGELFDHLVEQGAYSEADASRLIREVAAALNFIHGIGITHADLKPENLMMSSKNSSDATIKLVDFGCSQVVHDDDDVKDGTEKISLGGKTLAYCPPEILIDEQRNKMTRLDPSLDMWSLGIILYIMLTGVHPYDLNGQASDEEVAEAMASNRPPPIRDSPITAHLSESAIDLIEKLMCRDAKKRLTAFQMLHHDWVKGITPNTKKMVASDKKLSYYPKHKVKIQAMAFEFMVEDSQNTSNEDNHVNRISRLEGVFHNFDKDKKGHITTKDISRHAGSDVQPSSTDVNSGQQEQLSMSELSSILSENMIDTYFPKGTVVYREGEVGNHIYFIDAGTVSVETSTGFFVRRSSPSYFGEGAMFDPSKRRSATVRCETPVHTVSINREYFEKYLEEAKPNLYLAIRETDKIRKRNRTRHIIRLMKDKVQREYRNGEFVFREGDDGDSLFVIRDGVVDIEANEKTVLKAAVGNVIGENALLTGQPRNCTAICNNKTGCVLDQIKGKDMRKLMKEAPYIKTTLEEMCIRRDFKKAVVLKLHKEFPYDNPREAFDAIKVGDSEFLDFEAVAPLMRTLNPSYTDKEISEIIKAIDLNHSGSISYDEFKKVFVADKKGSTSL